MRRILSLAVVLATLSALPGTVLAGGVVGTGTAGSCTEAALDAALAGGGRITFDCGGPAAITVTSTKIIETDTAIDGAGLITISGGNWTQVLLVGFNASLELDGVAVVDGFSGPEPGGGIRNIGMLTLNRCTVADNVSGSFGGGLDNEGTCVVSDSTFVDNNGGAGGGGIANFRSLSLRRSTIFRNTAGVIDPFGGDNSPGSGGGIANLGDLVAGNSTFVANTAVSKNHAYYPVPGFGGGLDNEATADVTNCTFFRNGAPGVGYEGGIGNNGLLSIKNTIIADSINGGCGDIVNGVETGDSTQNLSDGGGCGPSFAYVKLADLRLGGLADNGGPTFTIALLPGSVAIGAGDTAACVDAPVDGVDQRGHLRLEPGDAKCDVGAFETPFSAVPLPTPTPAMTFLTLAGDAGEYVSGGSELTLTDADGVFSVGHAFGAVGSPMPIYSFGYVLINFQGRPGEFWRLFFAAPVGRDLLPGDYDETSRWPSEEAPGLDVGGEGRGCNSITGRFSVRQAVYAIDGSVLSFAVDFEQHCEGGPAALFGSFRLNSNVPTAPPPSYTASATPTVTPTRPTPSATPSPTPPRCYGDCNGDGAIGADELMLGVNVSLERAPLSECPLLDADDNGRVTVDELAIAVLGALDGCQPL